MALWQCMQGLIRRQLCRSDPCIQCCVWRRFHRSKRKQHLYLPVLVLFQGLCWNGPKVFTNGGLDPWRALSVKADFDASARSPSLLIANAAHCADLGSSSQNDPQSLTDARMKIAAFFRAIIGTKEADEEWSEESSDDIPIEPLDESLLFDFVPAEDEHVYFWRSVYNRQNIWWCIESTDNR